MNPVTEKPTKQPLHKTCLFRMQNFMIQWMPQPLLGKERNDFFSSISWTPSAPIPIHSHTQVEITISAGP